jgi:hypothetical protein
MWFILLQHLVADLWAFGVSPFSVKLKLFITKD